MLTRKTIIITAMLTRKTIIIICAATLALAIACSRREARSGKADSATSNASGAARTLKAAQPVRVSAENTDAAEPAVAAGRDGTAYVAWVEHRAGGEADVWLAHLDGEGKQMASPARVNTEAGAATAWRGDPPTVALAPDGTIYVGWTARASGGAHASTLQLSASRDGGRTFAAPVKVNDDAKPGVHGMHSLAVSADGRVLMAWLDERNVAAAMHMEPTSGGKHTEGNRELFFASSTDGGRTFSANRRVATEVCPCCKTALALAPDGRVYLSWRQVLPGDFRHIAVASSADGGETFAQPVIVSDDKWQIAGCPVSGAALAVAPDGVLRVLWYSAGEGAAAGLYWSESRDGGRTFAPRKPFAERAGSSTPILINDGGNLVAVWEDNSDGSTRVAASRLNDEGQTLSDRVLTGAGELPAASAVGRMFVAYVAGSSGQRQLWLVSMTPPPGVGQSASAQ
jgi:hypothetical protein